MLAIFLSPEGKNSTAMYVLNGRSMWLGEKNFVTFKRLFLVIYFQVRKWKKGVPMKLVRPRSCILLVLRHPFEMIGTTNKIFCLIFFRLYYCDLS